MVQREAGEATRHSSTRYQSPTEALTGVFHRKQEPVVRTAAADKRELTHRRQRRTSTEIPKSPKVHKLKEARLRTEPPDPKATNTIDKKQIFTCKRNPFACVQSQED
ncbi:hypothetical protein Bca101_000988 [Brassica carinata]